MLLKIDFAGMPLLAQTLFGAMTEFGVMGFGITAVCVLRKESFASFGLKKEKLLLTIPLSALACLPSFLFLVFQSPGMTYHPFQGVNFTRPVLGASFPVNVLGMLLVYEYTGNAWGPVLIYCLYWNAF